VLRSNRPALALATLLTAGAALAQGAASAPAAAASPAKKALVAKLLKLQQPGIESMARQLVEQPALQLLQRADVVLQRVPQDRREQLAKDIQADARRYIDETTPIARERAIAIAPQTIGPILESRLSEDELKQVIAVLESPANRKFQSLFGEMQRALGERLVADTRSSVEPKVRQLEQSVAGRFDALAAAPAGAASAASAAKP